MKKTLLLSVLLLVSFSSFGQWLNKGFTFETRARTYRVYVPTIYDASKPASMVLTLHGLGDNIANFSQIGMNSIADTANIIVVVPQALPDVLAGAAWNSGAGYFGYYPNATINDVVFLSALIDTVSANYAIDPNKVFSCGFSMGGFMTERLACELNDKVKAFASVAGTFGQGLPPCTPNRAVSVAHFHGTADTVVPYDGPTPGLAVNSLMAFWATNNQCDATPLQTNLPDTQNDGFTVEHYVYQNGLNNTNLELFKVNGADHDWLTSANDINYTREIWNFFRKQQFVATGVAHVALQNKVSVYPNPSNDLVMVDMAQLPANKTYLLQLFDYSGKLVFAKNVAASTQQLSVKNMGLANGLYLLSISADEVKMSQTITVVR